MFSFSGIELARKCGEMLFFSYSEDAQWAKFGHVPSPVPYGPRGTHSMHVGCSRGRELFHWTLVGHFWWGGARVLCAAPAARSLHASSQTMEVLAGAPLAVLMETGSSGWL